MKEQTQKQNDMIVELHVPEKTMVRIEGIPFWTVGDVILCGHEANFQLVGLMPKDPNKPTND